MIQSLGTNTQRPHAPFNLWCGMYEDTMDNVRPCVMPMCTPMKPHATSMPAGDALHAEDRNVLATRSIIKPITSTMLRSRTPLPFAYCPTERAVTVVASIVTDASIGSITLGTAHCIPQTEFSVGVLTDESSAKLPEGNMGRPRDSKLATSS